MEHLEGRVAVITGAASGIGAAMARRFGAAGMRLMLADIEPDTLGDFAAELRGEGRDVSTFVCDVSDAAAVDALATATMEAYEAVHLVCNNAGVGAGGPMADVPLAEWEWVLGVNLWGVIHGVRSFLPLLRLQDEAHIVNTASVAGLFSAPFMGPYNVSKFGVVTLSETLFHELRLSGDNVGVSVLCPAWVRTRIHESQRNRPEAAGGTVEVDGGVAGIMAGFINNGMDPDKVASDVLDAVVTNRFYILTHDDSDVAVRMRADAIVASEPPPFVMPQ
jgi:NAD(P)-dependent dehydrogenase (short-subunit alcohol dehydrogenase family)